MLQIGSELRPAGAKLDLRRTVASIEYRAFESRGPAVEIDMPNIAAIFKEEIVRLARKELRGELEGIKKASAQYRSDIAALKRRVASLEKQQARLVKKGSGSAASEAEAGATTRFRFSAKRLAAQRGKLGLSAADMGALLGVSAQSIYHWESGKTRPRQQQIAAIAALRKLGKREAKARLEGLKA